MERRFGWAKDDPRGGPRDCLACPAMHFDKNHFSRHLARAPLALAAILLAACGSKSSNNTTKGTGGSSSKSSTTTTAGTGGEKSGTGGSSSGGAAMMACEAEATALCALRDSCSPGFDIDLNFGSLSVCEARTAQTCVNALGAKGQGTTPAEVEMCAAAYPDEMCTDYDEDNPVAQCRPSAGTLAKGAPCGDSGQCASGFCAVGPLSVCGTCQALPVAGAPCLTEAGCGPGLACANPPGKTAGKCIAFVALGGACLAGSAPCGAGLVCVGDDPKTMKMGKCGAVASTAGATCDVIPTTAANCDGNKGLVCVPSAKGSNTGKCTKITLVAAGATCGVIGSMPATGFAACEAGGLCRRRRQPIRRAPASPRRRTACPATTTP